MKETFRGFIRDFEDEMDGFEKSAKTTGTPPQVPFQTKTRAHTAAEVATAEIVAVNATDTNTITATENLSKHQTGTLNPAISNPILVDLNSPGDSHSMTGTRSVTDARVMTDDSSAVADVLPMVGALQSSLLRETFLNFMRLELKWIFTDNDSKTRKPIARLNIHDVNSLKRDYNITSSRRNTSWRSYGYATMK